ncbi:hypothetical protein EJB05_41647 [Eragrostis curvula]|uniref:C3H1-type domain-containing protein n=1 Tax=Eragrostis curvula TaxID=38414 RepID=A0A5J9TA06_9POAL|nr:hypothetical protein EJB05_41647 [Eragrostis curvula]
MHSDSKGNRKMLTSTSTMPPVSPQKIDDGYPRRTAQKGAPPRVSVWQRIEENPSAFTPSSPRQLSKDVHISPSKTKNTGRPSKELASVISLDCKAISPSKMKSTGSASKEPASAMSLNRKVKTGDCKDSGDNGGTKKSAGKKSEKVLASVLVKPSPESKDKEVAVKQATRKPDKVQNNVPGFSNGNAGLTACRGAGVKKVKKIVIKKIVRKIGAKDKQTSGSTVSEQKDSVDANANVSDKEEGEITTSSFEKDDSSVHNLVSISDTAGVVSCVDAEKEQNDGLMNLSKSNAASESESIGILDTASVSGSQQPEKEADKSFMNPCDISGVSVADSTKGLDTIGSEHPGGRGCMDSDGQNAALLCENGNTSHKEEDGMAVSGVVNVVVGSNSPRMPDTTKLCECDVSKAMTGNNVVCVNGVKDDTKQICESSEGRSKNSNILPGSNEKGDIFTNNSFRSPSTVEASVSACKDIHRKEDSEMGVASLGVYMETPKIAEPSMTQDTCKEEGNMLNSPKEMGIVSVSSLESPNGMEFSVNDDIEDKNGRIPMEQSKANASVTHHVNARDGLKASVEEDIHEKECITSCEAATFVIHHEKAPNTIKLSMNENIQKKESQMPIDSNALKTAKHIEALNTADVFTNKVAGSEVCRSPMESDEKHANALDNSIDAPDIVLASGTEDSHTQDLLHVQETALDKTDLHRETADTEFSIFPLTKNVESSIMPLDGDLREDPSGPIILNTDVGKDTIPQAAELMHLHRADLSPANNLSLLHSHDSPSISVNSEHSPPTALTLGNNTYFSSAESEQPEEYHKLIESSKGLDDVTATEFSKIEEGESESGKDLINADAQNWLTLPLAVNYVNIDTTVSMNRFDLEQNVDEDTSVSQDHGSMPDMDQCGRIDAFDDQDHSRKISCSNMAQSDLLALKEREKNIENEREIVLPDSSASSVNVLDNNPNKPIVLSSQSAGVTGGELASQVYIDPGDTCHSNTMDESGTKPDFVSSWFEFIVSEATKDHQPCKSTPDKILGLKEDTKKAFSDPFVNSALKSPPRMNIASSTVPKVLTKQVGLPGSSRDTARLNQNARHRTWHRDNVSSKSYLHASQPSGLPPKLPLKKNDKTQNCYIRKGNALIRNPATGNHPQSSPGLDAPSKLSKPVMRRSMNFVRKVDSKDTVARSNISVERPKTPPLPLHTKSITTNILEPFSQSLQKQQVPETEKNDSSGQVNLGVDKPSVTSQQKSEPLDAGKVVYVRPKSNQLVASQGQQSGDLNNSSIDKGLLSQPSTTSDLYFKKRKNQIILGSSTSDVLSSKDTSQAENSNTGETKVLMLTSSNKNLTLAKDGPHKTLQKTNTVGSFSHVWTLSGQHPQRKPFVGTSHMKAFPRILPWKRKVFGNNFRSNYSSLLNTSSLGIVRKLLKTRKRGTIYTVSTNGFSLRKSGVLSFDGSSLKWSRSLEKGSQKVNEEATLAVAAIDRKRGEKRKRHSLHNKGRNDQYSLPVATRNNNPKSSDSRVPSTCNEYVRINKGNQLVRNPKKVIRMLASEKVRWSLHTVRSRLAKKQQYCQFFTRFGECKKSGGKCPYIHDRAKVAICTKFLKGLCSNTSCKLTHKVLPERMPDCSYFLRGLCSNTACPYRHVKVNSNAPVCEDFLKGYCADGDECRKKHSYVCPVFEATGECPQQSRCKLHHPKKKIKSKRSRVGTLQNNSWGRYFDSSICEGSEAMRGVCLEEEDKQKQEHAAGGDLADFIGLGADIDGSVEALDDIHLVDLDSGNLKTQADNLDALIKPLRIMRTARV